MKRFFFFLFLFVSSYSYGQGTQNHPNSLFPTQKFLSFVNGLDFSENILIGYDFTIAPSDLPDYVVYRINHTAPKTNSLRNEYLFDQFYLYKKENPNSFLYMTSSNKNFLAYKQKLIKYGFSQTPDPTILKQAKTPEQLESAKRMYYKKIGKYYYAVDFTRTIHSSGTPNFKIGVMRYSPMDK